MGDKTDDIIKELANISGRIRKKDEKSNFVFKSVDLFYYSLHKTRLRRGKSYIESPEWLRNKIATINPQNKDDNNCFQYAITVALNHQNIENHPERISNIKPFSNQYNWKDIYFPAHQRDQKKFKQEDWEKLKKKGNWLEKVWTKKQGNHSWYIIYTTQYKNNKACIQIKI